MSDTTFVAYSNATPITASWLNDINHLRYGENSASRGSSLLQFLQSGTGAVVSNVQDKVREFVSVLDYATATQKTDIAALTYAVNTKSALDAAFAMADRKVLISKGGYSFTTALAAPVCGIIEGEGWGSILAPANGVLTALSWGTAGPNSLRDFYLAGNTTTNARGIVVGESSPVTNVSMTDINVQDYSGSNAIGIYLRDIVGLAMMNVRSSNNKYPLVIDRASGSYPTTISINGSSFRAGDYNIFVASGGDIWIGDTTCEAAQQNGLLVSPALGASYAALGSAHVTEFVVDRVHFEANCLATPSDLYNAVVNANAANTSAKVYFKDCTFDAGSSVKAVLAAGQFTEVVVSNPRCTTAPPAGWLTANSNALLVVRDWDVVRLGSPYAGAIAASGGGRFLVENVAPCFEVRKTSNTDNQTGNGTLAAVSFDTESFDDDNSWSAGTYTAKWDGRYFFSANVLITDLSTDALLAEIHLITTGGTHIVQQGLNPKASALQTHLQISKAVAMLSGETATISVKVTGMAGDTADIYGGATLLTNFSGHRVSATAP